MLLIFIDFQCTPRYKFAFLSVCLEILYRRLNACHAAGAGTRVKSHKRSLEYQLKCSLCLHVAPCVAIFCQQSSSAMIAVALLYICCTMVAWSCRAAVRINVHFRCHSGVGNFIRLSCCNILIKMFMSLMHFLTFVT